MRQKVLFFLTSLLSGSSIAAIFYAIPPEMPFAVVTAVLAAALWLFLMYRLAKWAWRPQDPA